MDTLKMAACGIDCNVCGQYRVTTQKDIKAAESLVPWVRSQGWIGETDGAEAVMEKAPLCAGCWDKSAVFFFLSGECGNCGLRACCESRQINHCGQCVDFPCDQYEKWVDHLEHHEKARETLHSLKHSYEQSGQKRSIRRKPNEQV